MHYSSTHVLATDDKERRSRRSTFAHPVDKKHQANSLRVDDPSGLDHSTDIVINDVESKQTESLFEKTITASQQKDTSVRDTTEFYPKPVTEIDENSQSVKSSLLADGT